MCTAGGARRAVQGCARGRAFFCEPGPVRPRRVEITPVSDVCQPRASTPQLAASTRRLTDLEIRRCPTVPARALLTFAVRSALERVAFTGTNVSDAGAESRLWRYVLVTAVSYGNGTGR